MAKYECLYCGNVFRRNKRADGEHVMQRSLGTRQTIPNVCDQCNNDRLAQIDEELVGRSPLSLAVHRVLKKTPEYAWDQFSSDGSLLEARPREDFSGNYLYPQLHLANDQWRLFGDQEEVLEVGQSFFGRYFFDIVRSAARNYPGSDKRFSKLVHQEVRPTSGAYFPPRMFTRRKPKDFKDNMTIIFRYCSTKDRHRFMDKILSVRSRFSFQNREVIQGSPLGTIQTSYELIKVLRALVKISVNTLAFVCRNTEVSFRTFPEATKFVLTGEGLMSDREITQNGFVEPRGLESIADSIGSHTIYFRHLHEMGYWYVCISFFGGLAGARVRFPGPNNEPWRNLLVTAPINGRNWTTTPMNLDLCTSTRVCNEDTATAVPIVPLFNPQKSIRIERNLATA